jgi:hypothetical protein
MEFFWGRILRTICLGWPQTLILLISASWVARITDVNHQYLAPWICALQAVRLRGSARSMGIGGIVNRREKIRQIMSWVLNVLCLRRWWELERCPSWLVAKNGGVRQATEWGSGKAPLSPGWGNIKTDLRATTAASLERHVPWAVVLVDVF